MNSDTHTPPLALPYGFESKARWSLKPEKKLLVFVHGFSGAALSTWSGLPNQLCSQNEAKGYDIVHFGYESVPQTADESANQLHKLLNALLFDTMQTVNHSLRGYDRELVRVLTWEYERMVLVGHSLGACVVRRAMLNQIQAGKGQWPNHTKLIWFAPAHGGARLFRLLLATSLGLSIKGLVEGATYLSPALGDLEPKSDFLKDLRDQTVQLSGAHPQLKAPLTFWAWKDKVVLNTAAFTMDDKPYEEVRGVNHVSICKPSCFDNTVRRMLKELI